MPGAKRAGPLSTTPFAEKSPTTASSAHCVNGTQSQRREDAVDDGTRRNTPRGVIASPAVKSLTLTLFLIGSGLSVNVLKKVGVKPLVQGVALWFLIASMSLAAIVGFA